VTVVDVRVSADEAAAAGLRSFEHLTGIALACSSAEPDLRVALVRAANDVGPGFAAHRRPTDDVVGDPVYGDQPHQELPAGTLWVNIGREHPEPRARGVAWLVVAVGGPLTLYVFA
jgi:hypothetical protein